MSDQGHELGWNDTIQNDGEEFITLPEAQYRFTVKKFERGRFQGSGKVPACNQANITIELDGGELGRATITEKLKLHSMLEWVLCQFFVCIGDRKSGDPLVMDWGAVVGKSGVADVGIREYGDKNEKSINTVNKWLPPNGATPNEQSAPPPQQTAYQPGVF